jgi:hypothetical protein
MAEFDFPGQVNLRFDIFVLSIANAISMNIEAQKLKLIERFMKFQNQSEISQLEDALSKIEMEMRAKASEGDIATGKVRSYESFSEDVKSWMGKERNMK